MTVQPQPRNFQHSLIFKKEHIKCYDTYQPQGDFSKVTQIVKPSRQPRQPELLANM
jgi:hypothetical protein